MNISALALKLFEALPSRTTDSTTRPSYSAEETEAHAVIRRTAESWGLLTTVDAAGNTWVTLTGTRPKLPAIVCGSHLDSVPCGGNYDGAAGVIAGLLALKGLQDSKTQHLRTVHLLALRGEESAWFGKAYLGARALFQKLTTSDLQRTSKLGLTLEACMVGCGGDPVRMLQSSLVNPRDFGAYLELHIEQGPVLENAKHALGIVTGIRGNIRCAVVCVGEAGHSGTTPMHLRHDAVMATAAFLVKLRDLVDTYYQHESLEAGTLGSTDLVFTVGRLHTDATKDAVSVIADHVRFSLEWRSLHSERLGTFELQGVRRVADEVASKHGVRFEFEQRVETSPGFIDNRLAAVLEEACDVEAIPSLRLPSGAGHDAVVFSSVGIPTAMLFVRNQHGSHNPSEARDMDDFVKGVRVLERALHTLANTKDT